MGDWTVEEIKAYVPARDFALSKGARPEDVSPAVGRRLDPGYACFGACCVPVM